MSSLIGRETELDQVDAFVRAVAHGPAILVVDGEAGAGKTTLWEEGLARATGEAQVITCRPVRSEIALPYAVLGELIGDALNDPTIDLPVPQRRALEVALRVSDAMDRSIDHRAVAAGVLSAFTARARDGPLVVAVDDLQWLDRSSARSVGFAIRRLGTEPIGVLATLRLDADDPHGPEVSDILRERRVQRLTVGPLSVEGIERLLGDRLQLALPRTVLLKVHASSRGNPLYAIEIGRALVQAGSLPGPGQPLPLPGDLRSLLVRRLHPLPPGTREALLLASLLPQAHEHVLAQALGERWGEAVALGCACGIIEIENRMVRFVHPLLAEAVAADASEPERRDAHARLAEAAVDSVARARHLALAAAGPSEAVAQALEQAALDLAHSGAPDAAAEMAELSRVLTPPDSAGAFRRCTIAGDARFTAGDSVRAVELFCEAAALADPGAERAEALWRMARVRYHYDDISAAKSLLEEARLEAGDDLELRAGIDHDLAYPCFALTDLAGTLRHAQSATELAERSGSVQILADGLAQIAVAEFLLGSGIRQDLLDRARALEDWDQPRPAILRPSIAAAHVMAWAGRIETARSLIHEAERLLLERGDEGALPFLWYHAAELDCWSGDWKRGRQTAIEADRIARQTRQDGTRTLVCYSAALLAAHLGLVEEARHHAMEGVQLGTDTNHLLGIGLNVSVLGFLELSLGRPDRAHAMFGPLVLNARRGGFEEPGAAWWLADEIEALVALGERDEARLLTDWLEERARAIDHHTGLAGAARSRALLLAADGRTDEALARCDEALAAHDRVQVPFPRGRTLFTTGQIARKARKWGVARASLESAVAVFDELGARLWSERARDELARIGGRRATPTELTQTERRIAALVAAGHSNRDVAAILFLAPSTISTNLGRVYRKLGVTTRTEMAARLHHEPPP